MSKPILSLQSNQSDKGNKAVANLLPCRIHHDGPVGATEHFWNPNKADDGKHVAYFRGRKLHGTTVKLPEQYRGVVMEKSDKPTGNRRPEVEEEIEEEEQQVETGAMDIKAEFDEIVIWGHEASADAASDPYVRSIEEWLTVAEQIHSYPPPEASNGA
ncbi:ribonuclease h2 subunit c [Colletotrichum truncatum]|uniref:Ribonuclease h2 subunit c n=1 Tax=Colletotrichum truncatum TaxID=5467 RepID=A0ACC3ZKL4_COLTU|nr:ribonuclease h2 subunit c [Colletotrichum truncatum]KAF6799988.1 ribonuclease h2 subunit c [Colletotrichum truncatum]